MKWSQRIVAISILQLLVLIFGGTVGLAAGEETGSGGYISGLVFYDLNGDGQASVGEPNSPHATVFIQREGEEPRIVEASAEGFFVANNLAYGVYRVWAQDAESNRSSIQTVTLDEVNGASSLDLPISRNSSEGAQAGVTDRIFLPLVNR